MVSLIKTFIVVFLIFVSGSLFLRSLLYFWKEVLTFGSSEIKTLLIQNQLADSEHLFTKKGISLLSQCGEVGQLPELPAPDEQRLQEAAELLQQRLVLRQWLTKNQLQSYHPRLLSLGVGSLEDVYWLEDGRARRAFGGDFSKWSAARQALPTSKQPLDQLKADLWAEVVKGSSHRDAWTWGGMLVVSVSVAGLVTLAAMTQPSLAPEAKHSLLQYVTGKYLLPSNCKLAVITELGSPTDPACANVAKVKFTVRHAGQYKVSVTVAERHVAGSPFAATFVAGPPCAQRTHVLRHCSTVVCTANIAQVVYVEPRDEYGNVCRFEAKDNPVEGYAINIAQLGLKSPELPLDATGDEENCSTNLEYDWESQRVMVQLKFVQEGCYHATIFYRGTELHNGDFDIIVLNSIDSTLVHKNVASKNHNVCYEAKLVGINGDRLTKPKKVLCYVSPKQLIIKELILKFIPKRLFTFRLCPSTKFNFQGQTIKSAEINMNSFTVDDGCQPKIELVSRERNVIAATFAQFLLKNMGGSETFKDKQDFFYHEVRKFHQKHYHEKLSMKVNREKLLDSSMKATKNFSVSDWCRNFEVSFQGEQGVDWGGLRREWFELICAQLFDAKHGLFSSFHEGQQSLVHPNPNRPSHLKLRHYEFAGKVVGKCLYESALGGTYRQLAFAFILR
nr:unnamed protein product [Callosobruchus chinensis]